MRAFGIVARLQMLLVALVALVNKREVEGISALDCFLPWRWSPRGGRVRWELMHSQPPRARSKETFFSSTLGRSGLAGAGRRFVGHGDVAQHADGDDLLIQVQGLSSPVINWPVAGCGW